MKAAKPPLGASLAVLAAAILGGCYEAHLRADCESQPEETELVPLLGAPSLERVGGPTVLAEGDVDAMGVPYVAWDGAGWNVAWGRRFARLDARAQLLGAIEELPARGDATSLAPGSCVRAVAAAGDAPGESVIAWLDAGGAAIDALRIPGIDAQITRGPGRFWIASDTSRERPELSVHAVRDETLGRPALRAAITDGVVRSPRVSAWGDAAVVSWIDREGIVQRAIGTRGSEASFRVMTANVWGRGAMHSETLRVDGRERVVVAATDGAMLHVAITDPAAREVVAGPIAVLRTQALRARPGIAPMPERGLIAVCVPSGRGPWREDPTIDAVSIAIVGGAATPLVRATSIAEGGQVRAASCAWSGRELLAAWWRAAGGREELAVQRVRLRDAGEPLEIVW